jgi:hypothetical protein
MVIRYCEVCGQQIPEERIEALPETFRCVAHSAATKTEGVVEYGHKTAGVILILPKDPEQRRQALRAYKRAR